MMASTVVVSGLAQIQRDLAKSGPAVSKAMREGLRESAEPVAKLAEELSLSRIRRMSRSPEWAVTRVGVLRTSVYVVPKERGVRTRNPFDSRRRPNLVGLMMGRSFEPALAIGEPIVEARVSRLLGEVIHG
jgi:hypothetical protein